MFSEMVRRACNGRKLRASHKNLLAYDFFKFKMEMQEKIESFLAKKQVALKIKERIDDIVKRKENKEEFKIQDIQIFETPKISSEKISQALQTSDEPYANAMITPEPVNISTTILNDTILNKSKEETKVQQLIQRKPSTIANRIEKAKLKAAQKGVTISQKPISRSKTRTNRSNLITTSKPSLQKPSSKPSSKPPSATLTIPTPDSPYKQSPLPSIQPTLVSPSLNILPPITTSASRPTSPPKEEVAKQDFSLVPIVKLCEKKKLKRMGTQGGRGSLKNLSLDELKIGGLSDDQVADQFENEVDEELEDEEDERSESQDEAAVFK
mmetsp:Transcript_1428/g.1639  ORF Transcript_1428/g.1639 Transcript_1428/m.1639 type:complete len:325 (+) Transcript_1428:421-1395(+)